MFNQMCKERDGFEVDRDDEALETAVDRRML